MNAVPLAYINQSVASDAERLIRESENSFDEALNSAVKRILTCSQCNIVLLAGPSSSGKTTAAKKLSEKIKQSGKNAFTLSLDDFYFDRDSIPFGKDGLRDFESIDALDVERIQSTFYELTTAGKTDLPVFDFKLGQRTEETRHIELEKDDVIIVEGLHALNPLIVSGTDSERIFKIYISVSSRVTDDDGKIILNKRNIRLSRRLIRDSKHRNMTAESTLMQWQSVLSGEDTYLYPFESFADLKINSFHSYEPCIVKNSVLSLLKTVGTDSTVYAKVAELRAAFEKTEELGSAFLPETSLLCEFLR